MTTLLDREERRPKRSAVDDHSWWRDGLGAFADGAILFPILAALSQEIGFSGPTLLVTAGLAYISSGFFFRVPLSVQPLKSIAIAALAIGASMIEVRWAAFLLGSFCLLLSLFDVSRFSQKIPSWVIHGVQLGLGLILMIQGAKYVLEPSITGWLASFIVALSLVIFFVPLVSGVALLGLVSTVGLVIAVVSGVRKDWGLPPVHNWQEMLRSEGSPHLRWPVVMSLMLPQMVLTLANSVVGTQDVCRRYFGDQARRVTEKRLLLSIGLGNVLSALVAGLPFCHGAGGVTAHYQGGARSHRANLIVGGTLLFLALIQWLGAGGMIQFSPFLMAILLLTTGLFHLQLARPTWERPDGKIPLVLMGATAVLTQNLLLVLMFGFLIRGLRTLWERPYFQGRATKRLKITSRR